MRELRQSLIFLLGLLPLSGTSQHGEPNDWVRESGYSWKELTVPTGEAVGFRRLDAERTRIDFVNHLDESRAIDNRILENGSGVAAADIDGDGRCDLYFARLDGDNALYRNLGGFRFENVTESAGVACSGQASTGATLTDLDGDGDPDLLVTGIESGVRCFLNDSTGRFEEVLDSGLDRTSGSMSMALADGDGDGDPDLYVTNYRNVTWKDFPPGVSPKITRKNDRVVASPADRFRADLRSDQSVAIVELGQPDGYYLNEGDGTFRLESWTDGRFLGRDGKPLTRIPRNWGLSVAFRDFNGDLTPDLYVCNDFLQGNDELYLNDGAGTFRLIEAGAIRHASWSSMAVDVADFDRDGHFDFLVVDMLSQDPVLRLTQKANLETGQQLRPPGQIWDCPQRQHNTLYRSRGDGTWMELAHAAGLEATEWSWNVLFLDVDLDGYEDVLIANGNAHDLLDGDATMDAMQAMRSAPRHRKPKTLSFYPPLPLPDIAFRNRGDRTFERRDEWGFNLPGVSQGLCRADLDNDGDWDLVLNQLQSPAAVFENLSSGSRIRVRLQGRPPNTFALGSLVELVPQNETRIPAQKQEITAGGSYLSSHQPGLTFAGGGPNARYRLTVTWPDRTKTVLPSVRSNRACLIVQPNDPDPISVPAPIAPPETLFENVSRLLDHRHVTTPFDDFKRQPLLPNMLSRLGPGINWADVDRDGFDDLIVPSGQGGKTIVFQNQEGESFRQDPLAEAEVDQHGAVWMNLDDDRFGLAIGQSNYRHGLRYRSAVRIHTDPRATPLELSGQRDTVGPLTALDYDSDGDLDLFVGGRLVPGKWPQPPTSRLYRNLGGRFRLDWENSRQLAGAGMVSGATAFDVDNDGDCDLALIGEWGHPQLFLNEESQFREASTSWGLTPYRGWWNGIAAGDFDEDGQLDLIATNWGRNTPYQRFRARPLRLRYGDLDGNGSIEAVELIHDPSRMRWSTWRDLIPLGTAIPALQNRVHSYRLFAENGLESYFPESYPRLKTLEADWLENTVFLNRNSRFVALVLPFPAQTSPAFGVTVGDFDGDGHEDLILAQNFFATRPGTTRHDAGEALLLTGDGTGNFTAWPAAKSGVRLMGEQRGAAAADFDHDGRLDFAIGQHGSQTALFRNRRAKPAHRVRLIGKPGNRDGIGTRLRWKSGTGPAREVRSGSGYWSQDSSVTLWPSNADSRTLLITWPGGSRTELEITGPPKEWVAKAE